jgi:hypothetical protein
MHLHDATAAVKDLEERRDWDQMITDWEAYGTIWDRHAESLARVLETDLFMMVSSAFAALASLARSRAMSAGEPAPPAGAPPNFSVPPELLTTYRFLIETADDIVLNAAWTRRERRQLKLGRDSARTFPGTTGGLPRT